MVNVSLHESTQQEEAKDKREPPTNKIQKQQELPLSKGHDTNNDQSLRCHLGRLVIETQQTIDSHLLLFRVGLIVTVAVSAVASIKLSGVLTRFNSVEDIPPWQFMRRKKLRVRMIRQAREDPSVFYVYHTPIFRRLMLKDVLPPLPTIASASNETKRAGLLAVRPFGVDVAKSSEEWVWSNFISSNRYLTIRLLQRHNVKDSESIATCIMTFWKPPLGKDFAHELISQGYAKCIPENLKDYDNGSPAAMSYLAQRLKKLNAAQKRAQSMQYGIWKDWQEAKLSDRLFSASKRATTKGFSRLFASFRH
ncbi:hypothetical protein CCR75_006980 [Bremia lactucae]|uniref:Uncharacterized protein n=1 Tax=Bremia lactucae TaxID=4779 RepID=A0A976FMC7_BRELC|nr:hypothetical protein CCR75_006980 [Bremia lactucae]